MSASMKRRWSDVEQGLFAHDPGRRLLELCDQATVLVVLLRHAGCPFTQATLAELKRSQTAVERIGCRLAVVHMFDDARAEGMCAAHGLPQVPRICDPKCQIYSGLGLPRASLWQVAGPAAWWPGFKCVACGHWPGAVGGSVRQLSGAAVFCGQHVAAVDRCVNSWDVPDFVKLVRDAIDAHTASG